MNCLLVRLRDETDVTPSPRSTGHGSRSTSWSKLDDDGGAQGQDETADCSSSTAWAWSTATNEQVRRLGHALDDASSALRDVSDEARQSRDALCVVPRRSTQDYGHDLSSSAIIVPQLNRSA